MTASSTGAAPRRIGDLWRAARAGEWWEYKLVPIFAIGYATALHVGVPIAALWAAWLVLLAALVPGAVYVSVVNDLTDRRDDAAAGKANRMAGRGPFAAALMVALPVACGLGFAWAWRNDALLLLAYLAAWAAFTLYSLPPLRLKVRGLAGVFADASGAHLFPTLVAALLVFREAGARPDGMWMAAVAAWAAGYGLRGILWHQLSDRDSDSAAGVRTFAQRRSANSVERLVRLIVFPLEAVGLATLLWLIANPLPVLLLLLYLLLVGRRISWWNMTAVLARPRPRYLILLADYYDVFLPLGLLLASALAHPIDLAAVLIHLGLFPRRAQMVAREAWRLRTHRSAHRPA